MTFARTLARFSTLVFCLGLVACETNPLATPETVAAKRAGVSLPTDSVPLNQFSPRDPFDEPHEDQRLVIRLVAGTNPQILVQYGVMIEQVFGNYAVVSTSSTNDGELKSLANLIEDDSLVRSAEPSAVYFLGNDIVLGFFETDPRGQSGVVLDTGWTSRASMPFMQSFATGMGVTVALLDGGVDRDVAAAAGIVGGYDFVDNDDDPWEEPGSAYGHGTLVTDITRQVAPNVNVLPLRVMNGDGMVLALDVVRALEHARDAGAQVVNLSFGGSVAASYVEDALAATVAAGIVVVASAGNQARIDEQHYPSSSPHVCSVAATNAYDRRALFSSYGPRIDVSAPGVGIIGAGPDGKIMVGSGTSMSAPMITAAIACKLQLSTTSWTVDQLRSALTTSGAPLLADADYQAGLMPGRVEFGSYLFTVE